MSERVPMQGHKLVFALRERAADIDRDFDIDPNDPNGEQAALLLDAANELERWLPPVATSPLAELLKPFRDDPINNSVVVLGDDEAVRVLSAFRMIECNWKVPRSVAPAASAALVKRWAWLVSSWKLDKLADEISLASGLSEETVLGKLNILVRNRLVYPDGTISKGAAFAIEAHAQTVLGLKPKRNQQPAPAVPKETK